MPKHYPMPKGEWTTWAAEGSELYLSLIANGWVEHCSEIHRGKRRVMLRDNKPRYSDALDR